MGVSNILWPKFTDIESAKGPIRRGAYVSFLLVAVSIVFGIINYPKMDLEQGRIIFDATWWAIIALGIFYGKSRVASILGLFRFTLNTVLQFIATGKVFGTYFATIVIIIIFLGSVRGTFAYHKITKSSIHRKNLIILNLLALIYSSFIAVIVFFIINPITNETNVGFFYNILWCPVMIIYFLTLIRKMPFTKNRVIVTYSIPESDLKSGTNAKTPGERIINSEEPSKE